MKEQLNKNDSGTGATHFIQAFGWSLSGFASALRHETAFRQELFLCCILVPLAFWIGDTGVELALLLGSLLLTLTRISHQFRRRQVQSFWQYTIVTYVYCQNTAEDGIAWADLW